MPRFTSDQAIGAIEQYRKGASTYEVAARYGVSRTAVKMLLRRSGVELRLPGRPSLPPHEVEGQIRSLRLSGARLRDIARRVGVGTSEVAAVLVRLGLHRRLRRGENSTARRRIQPEQEPTLAALYNEGATLAQLAIKYGCTLSPVRAALLRQGVSLRARGGAIKSFGRSSSFQQSVRSLWDQGQSQTAIAKTMGCSQAVVSNVLNMQGIQCRLGGDRHGRWKGGRRTDPSGYIHVLLASDHPYASMRTMNGYVLEHRLVMAEYLGRPLWPHETVHHIDGNRAHNDIENLQMRIGKHGSHVCYQCADCGSRRLQPVPIDG